MRWTRVFTVLAACPTLLGTPLGAAKAQDEELQAQESDATINAQLHMPVVLEMTSGPTNPQAFLNSKQAQLLRPDRPYDLTRYPEMTRAVEAPPRIEQQSPATSIRAASETRLRILENVGLGSGATRNIAGTVCEPSVAVSKRNEVLYTGNWFAALSRDGPEQLIYVNPSRALPEDDFEFCCDQVALYDPRHDLMIWFLQYIQDGSSNIIRIAVAHGEEDTKNIDTNGIHFYEFSPQSVLGRADEWFDYPDLALGRDHLYITTNSFATKGTRTTSDDTFARAVILRLPLDELETYSDVDPTFFETERSFSLRPTQGAQGGTMYFGGHDFSAFGSKLEVYTWPEGGTRLTRTSVEIDDWSDDDYSSTCLDGNRWLDRTDPRITAAWASGDRVGFAWAAGRDQSFPEPHVRVALISMGGQGGDRVVAQPHIWNEDFAFAYPAAATNEDGVAGLSICFGGGGTGDGRNPGMAVGVLREAPGGSFSWELAQAIEGTNGPFQGTWGDYLAVRPHGADLKTWVATGFALEGSGAAFHIVPRFVHFAFDAPSIDQPPSGINLREVRAELQQVRDRLNGEVEMIDRLIERVNAELQRSGSDASNPPQSSESRGGQP